VERLEDDEEYREVQAKAARSVGLGCALVAVAVFAVGVAFVVFWVWFANSLNPF
jgi:high-affinity Fe2+/Pb2+ permease